LVSSGASITIGVITILVIGGVLLFLPLGGNDPIIRNPFTPTATIVNVEMVIRSELFLGFSQTYFNHLEVWINVDNDTWVNVPLQTILRPQLTLFPESGDMIVRVRALENNVDLGGLQERGPFVQDIDIPPGQLVWHLDRKINMFGIPEGKWQIIIESDSWTFGPNGESQVVAEFVIQEGDTYPQRFVIIDDGILPGIPGI